MQDLGYARSTPPSVILLEDVVRLEANRAENEMRQAGRQMRQLRSTAQMVARAWGGGGGENSLRV
jgi:hypothetical protein